MRKVPRVAFVARFLCMRTGTSISLLPDFYASRMPGTLEELEHVAALAEEVGRGAAAEQARPAEAEDAVTLPAALAWVGRRVAIVAALLATVITLVPERLGGCAPRVRAVRARLGVRSALRALRGICAAHLHALPAPLGLVPPPRAVRVGRRGSPQRPWPVAGEPDG